MNKTKVKKHLKKVKNLINNIEDGEKISSLEKDLILSHLRDIYEAVLDEETIVSAVPPKPEPSKPTYVPPPSPPPVTYTPPPPPKPKPPVVKVAPKPKVETKVVQPTYTPPPVKSAPPRPEPPKVTPKETYTPPKTTYTPPPPPPPKPQPVAKEDFGEYEALFEEAQITELSQRLSLSPIRDLKTSMGINERFLVTNELFSGSQAVFNDVLTNLNTFTTFNQAKKYLAKNVAPKYDWMDKRREKRAKEFIIKVRRRYM